VAPASRTYPAVVLVVLGTIDAIALLGSIGAAPPRAHPPQPLRRRAAIRLNEAHAWLVRYGRVGGDQVWRARAVAVGGVERRQLWPLVCEHNPRLEAVQRKARRELPLIRLVDLVEA
jgi:hypothetical protein